MATIDAQKDKQTALRNFLVMHYLPDNQYQGNVFVCCKSATGKMKVVKTVKADAGVVDVLMGIEKHAQCAYYITANAFRGYERAKKELLQYKNIVLDIDMHAADSKHYRLLREELVEKLSSLLCSEVLLDYDLPIPNSIVATGRGLQVWYRLEDCSYKMDWMYQLVVNYFKQKMQDMLDDVPQLQGLLHVDKMASGSPAGLYRFPGTYNRQAGRFGRIQLVHDCPLDLAYYYDNHMRKVKAGEKQKHAAKYPHWSGDPNAIATFREKALLQLIALRQNNGQEIGEEMRDLTLLIAYCSMIGSDMTEEEVLEHVCVINSKFLAPMPEHEWMSYLSTARRKHYKYSNTRIIELLKITEEEQRAIGMHKTGSGRKSKEESEKTKAEKENKDAMIKAYCEEGKSKKEIAALVGCSEQTIGRRLQKWGMKTSQEKVAKRAFKAAMRGATVQTLMTKYGYSRSMAYSILKEAKTELAERKKKEPQMQDGKNAKPKKAAEQAEQMTKGMEKAASDQILDAVRLDSRQAGYIQMIIVPPRIVTADVNMPIDRVSPSD